MDFEAKYAPEKSSNRQEIQTNTNDLKKLCHCPNNNQDPGWCMRAESQTDADEPQHCN